MNECALRLFCYGTCDPRFWFETRATQDLETGILPTIVIYSPKIKGYDHLIGGAYITFPPEALVEFSSVRCQTREIISNDDVCNLRVLDTVDPKKLRGSITNGYFAHFEHTPRDRRWSKRSQAGR